MPSHLRVLALHLPYAKVPSESGYLQSVPYGGKVWFTGKDCFRDAFSFLCQRHASFLAERGTAIDVHHTRRLRYLPRWVGSG
jgi:hypothetical protein